MWLGIAVLLLIVWALGGFVFHVAGSLIHLLLILVVAAVIINFVTGRRTV